MLFVRLPLRFLVCFLRPPWGIMLLISGCIVMATFGLGHEYIDSLQQNSLFAELKKAKIDKKEKIAKKISEYDETGIRLLVQGLSSREEATALACHKALVEQLAEWRNAPKEQDAKCYLILSQELAKNSKHQGDYALQLSRILAQQTLHDILNRGFEGQRHISENCRTVIDAWQAGQPDFLAAEKLAQQSQHYTTIASGGEPKNVRAAGINVPYLTATSEDTKPKGRLQQLIDMDVENETSGTLVALSKPKEKEIANQKGSPTNPRVGFYSLHTAKPAKSQNENRILIAKKEQTMPPGQNASPFLDDELQIVAVNDVTKLPTQDLMKLLNHENWEISTESEAVLKKRDGFQDEHIQLATLLYHPQSDVRKSLLPQLIDKEDLETLSWVSELLKDPDPKVRLATANAVCYQIPFDDVSLSQLKKQMQSDSDNQVATLGQRLGTRIATGGDTTRQQR